jgi:hypothetical protein
MSRSATPWLPKRSPRGPRRGNRAAVGGQTAPTYTRGANRGHIFLWKTLLGPSRCAPERGPRGGPCVQRGSGSSGDARDRARILLGLTARYGAASSFGRNCSALRGLFAPSPFAHPIPRSRRRASGICSVLPSHSSKNWISNHEYPPLSTQKYYRSLPPCLR